MAIWPEKNISLQKPIWLVFGSYGHFLKKKMNWRPNFFCLIPLHKWRSLQPSTHQISKIAKIWDGFRIRIHLLRIQIGIQHFRLNTVPIRIRSGSFLALLDPDPDSEYGSGSTDLSESGSGSETLMETPQCTLGSRVPLIVGCVVRQVEHYRKKLLRKALEDTAAPSPPPPQQRKEKSTRHEEPDSDYSSSRSSKKEKRKKKQRDRSSSGKTDNSDLTT